MANALYDKSREKFLTGDIDWLSDDIKLVLVTSGYTPNLATHEFLSDVSNIQETSGNFAGKSATDGIADANDVTLSDTSGDPCNAAVIYKDTTDAETSPIIAYIDDAAGLPVSLGGDVVIRWDDGANKIFKL